MTRNRLLPPGEGNPRNSEGDFVELADGRLLFVYTRFTGGTSDHAEAHLAGRYSSDGGLTWTDEDVEILANEGGMNVMSVSLLRLADGRIALFYLRKNAIDDCRPFLRYSSDEGATWSEPTEILPADGGYYVLNNDRVVELKGGRLVVPLAKHGTIDGKHTPAEALCYLSDDGGATWRRSETVLAPPADSKTGLQEPGVVALSDGRLLMFSRTDQGRQYFSHSEDEGGTWSEAEPGTLVSPVSPATIERIPSTGDLLAIWNDHTEIASQLEGKRTPLTAAISRDDGATWENLRTLEDDPDGWYCYTAMHFAGDRVVLGHCAGNREIGGLNLTQVTTFPVDWIYSR